MFRENITEFMPEYSNFIKKFEKTCKQLDEKSTVNSDTMDAITKIEWTVTDLQREV